MRVFRQLMLAFSQGIIDYLYLFPLILIINFFTINQVAWWIWLISLIGLLFAGVLYRTMLPNQQWWMYFFISLMLGILLAFVFVEKWLLIGILGVIQTAVVYRGMMHVDQTRNRIPITYLWIGGFGVYVISYFVFKFVDILNPYLSLITVAGVALVIITMFLSNSDRLKSATLSKQTNPVISREVKGKNRLFLGITIMVIVLIANTHIIRDRLLYVVSTIVQAIFGDSPTPSEEGIGDEPPPSSSVGAPEGLPEGETSTLAKLFETIIMYSMYVLLIVSVILLLLLIVKQTRKHVMKLYYSLIGFLKQMITPAPSDEQKLGYVDEKENIFNWKEWGEKQQNKAKKVFNYFKREPSFRSLSSQEKVRYIYRQLVLQRKKEIDFKRSNTPRENLLAVTTSANIDEAKVRKLQIAYEQMRYGEKSIEEDVIDEIRMLLEE